MELRIYEHNGNQHNYVLRDDIIDEIISATADEVDKCVTRDWNNGLIKEWLASDLHCVIALKDELPDQVEWVGYNCSFDEEAQAIIDKHESTCDASHNWGVIGCAEDYVAFSDIDRYACKVWDWCEEAVLIELEEEHNMKIIHDESELVETFC
jgi:hypothetical protein